MSKHAELQVLKQELFKSFHSALPGIVESYDIQTQTVCVRPALKTSRNAIEFPLIRDVPVFFPGGCANGITFPVAQGDECLLIFADNCIDSWYETGEIKPVSSARMHDISDAFAFIGFRSKANQLTNVPSNPSFFGAQIVPVAPLDIVNIIYPVGSIYMSVNEVDPANIFNGTTWEQIKDKFLLAAGDTYANAATGGASEVVLDESQMPQHNHGFMGSEVQTNETGSHTHGRGTMEITGTLQADPKNGWIRLAGTGAFSASGSGNLAEGGSSTTTAVANKATFKASNNWSGRTESKGDHKHTVTANGSIGNTGGGAAHNNMPPYLAINIWKRIA